MIASHDQLYAYSTLEHLSLYFWDNNDFFDIYQALDTLGNTKWRINKMVLAAVDKIWANGGRFIGLVDREDVSCIFTGPF